MKKTILNWDIDVIEIVIAKLINNNIMHKYGTNNISVENKIRDNYI